MPAKFKERVPRVIRRDNGTDAWLIEGQELATFGLNAVQGRPRESWGADPASFDQVRPGTFDVHERIRDMNVNGVLASLNFPSWPGLGGQFFVQNDDTEFVEVDDPRLQRLAHRRVVWRLPRPLHPARAVRLPARRRVDGRRDRPGRREGLPRGLVPLRAPPLRHRRHPRARVGPARGRRATTSARSRCSTSAASRTSCPARRSR